MKKVNFIVLGALFLASLALLWLWWYLGFSSVDGPADVIISVVWWAAIVAMGYGIYRFEQRRRKQMRTVYVSPTSLYNCELGMLDCPDITQRAALVEEMVKSLKYGFDFQDMPEEGSFDYSYIIRTDDYRDAASWTGTVVKVGRNGSHQEKQFTSRAALESALA